VAGEYADATSGTVMEIDRRIRRSLRHGDVTPFGSTSYLAHRCESGFAEDSDRRLRFYIVLVCADHRVENDATWLSGVRIEFLPFAELHFHCRLAQMPPSLAAAHDCLTPDELTEQWSGGVPLAVGDS
jgi:hypothetical protein